MFYALSFCEGGAVMATELVGAKLLAPWFGTSLYVWTCVMALTLGGLAGGYFWGGRLSQKEKHERILMTTVLLAVVYLCLLPFLAMFLSTFAGTLPLIPAVLISSFIILLPPVFMMGMVSPLLIKSLTEKAEDSGKKSGEVYAISTLGGILFCFLTGFWLIPQFGLSITLFSCAVVLAIFPLVYFLRARNFTNVIVLALCFAAAMYKSSGKPHTLYASDGLLGKLEVRDVKYSKDSCRLLLVNNVIQSAVSLRSGESQLEYTSLIKNDLDTLGLHPKTALVLGLGGGVVANELSKKNMEVTAVELDTRVIDVARNYFSLDPKIDVIEDDARHALYALSKKFDLVVIDLFHGENTPWHVMTVESFEKIKSLMNEGGLIVINTYGYLKHETGEGTLVLLNTLHKSGLYYRVCYVGDRTHEDFRNFEIFCSPQPIKGNLLAEIYGEIPAALDEPVNTDARPVLEYANARAAKRWRHAYLKNFILNQ